MSLQFQYNFFESPEESERKAMIKKIEDIHISTERVRKKLFAENGALKKRVLELEERLDLIERNICKDKY